MTSDLSIRIGGDAGQGIESAGAALARAFARSGLHVFATQDYRSRIRGGHNFYQVRAAQAAVEAQRDPPEVLLAFTRETVDIHIDRLAPGAGILYDASLPVDAGALHARGLAPMPVPLTKIAADHGSRVMTNIAGLGALAGVVGFPLARIDAVLREEFAAKGPEVVRPNLAVAEAARRYAATTYPDFVHRVPRGDARPRLLLHGNHALALGAVAAGCRFIAAYPMTPATTILEYMAAIGAEEGIVAKHAEDEIAAVCMAIGAGFAGARAMTATSGGGFSLMAEALGLAGMAEVPVVIVDVQRGGPSTGLPTRTEQADLLFAIHASQGEFPRIVLAPGTVPECFEAGWRAFNLADRYQCPVIVLSDLYLAGSLVTVEPVSLDWASVEVDRGELIDGGALDPDADGYRRFAITESGISPRALPGSPAAVYAAPSDEHTEDGHITEEIHNRVAMMKKRMRKEDTALRNSIRGPARYGQESARITLVCWGSTLGAAREAAALLSADGEPAAVLHFPDLWPFPVEAATEALTSAGLAIGVEQNFTGQLAKLIRMMTGRQLDGRILAYDGRPFAPADIVQAVHRVLAGESDVHIEPGEQRLPAETEVGVNV
ncbi:MAG: 2-oxoacid:acceptor oxidoreductase subunit alpha [Chloroflexi bacterium]|nr:2-oxoacid:acceptor oxidoreductase subunit alpha [Chloroflexota bacterium]